MCLGGCRREKKRCSWVGGASKARDVGNLLSIAQKNAEIPINGENWRTRKPEFAGSNDGRVGHVSDVTLENIQNIQIYMEMMNMYNAHADC